MRAAVRALAAAATLAALLAATPPAAPAAQVYYVPLPEDQVYAALRTILPGIAACNLAPGALQVEPPIIGTVSIAAAADGTTIVYDHWEDGYEADLSRPIQPTTAVWGDGNPANGIPPGFLVDHIGAGDVIVLRNPVPVVAREAVIDFDGGDKLSASLPVSVARAAWASGTGSRLAGAVDMRHTAEWGRFYRAPVGENVAGTAMFEHVSLLVMARRDGTRVAIDADADGGAEISVTLAEGQSHHVLGGVRTGATVSASEPVQADLITGDICATHQSRWFSLEPPDRWSASAVAPVSTAAEDRTTVFLYNPGAAPVPVVRETLAGADTAVPVPAGGVGAFAVPASSAVLLRSVDGSPFAALGTVDTGDSEHEWGFPLVPEPFLTAQALVGWGPGRDPESTVNPGENGGPVWVTPVTSGDRGRPVAICIDFNGDNRGDLVDANGFRYDLRLALRTLEPARVYDPDGDQTGMLLYVCDDGQARLAVAWGQDPATASPGAPGIDIGTTVPPLPAMTADKDVALEVDRDGDGMADPGDTLRYVIRIRNISRRAVTGLVVSDELPAHTSYVPGSTFVDEGAGPVSLADAGLTPFPLDEGGALLGDLPAGAAVAVSFLVLIDELLPPEIRTLLNVAVVRSDAERIVVDAEIPLAPWEPRPSLGLVKQAVIENTTPPGTGTLGYWKNHPEAWPVAEIAAGGRTYSRTAAIALMARPGRGDKTLDLFRQYVAARLNVLAGNQASCVSAVLAAADAWLAAHPPGSNVRARDAAWAGQGGALHANLDDYNNGRLCAPHRDSGGAGAPRYDVVFTVTVTNTGNVALADVRVTDPALPACGAVVGTLAAFGGSASTTCRAEGVQSDLTNVALASGTAPDGVRVEARAEVFVDLPGTVPGRDATVRARTLASWRARPGSWPVRELVLGGAFVSREEFLATLARCAKRDVSCRLYGQLGAARLNLLAGAGPSRCVERPAGRADAWLAARPPGRGVAARSRAWRRTGRPLRDLLLRYNRGRGCPGR